MAEGKEDVNIRNKLKMSRAAETVEDNTITLNKASTRTHLLG